MAQKMRPFDYKEIYSIEVEKVSKGIYNYKTKLNNKVILQEENFKKETMFKVGDYIRGKIDEYEVENGIITEKEEVGDWIIGTGSVENIGNDRLIYAMKVEEMLTFGQYSKDKRFQSKIPNWKSNDPVKRVGDNIYYKNENNVFIQRPSKHSNKDGTENKKLKDIVNEKTLIFIEWLLLNEEGKISKNYRNVIAHGLDSINQFNDVYTKDNVLSIILIYLSLSKYGLS